MGLHKLFKTDPHHEVEGILLDYGDVRIRIARAGGANRRYLRALDQAARPYRRAIAAGAFSEEQAISLLRAVYAKTIILGWETKRAEWLPGIDPEDLGIDGTELAPVNEANIIQVFENLPDLFADIRQQAENITLFREAAAGN